MGRLQHRDRAFSALDAMLAHAPDMRYEMISGVERFERMRAPTRRVAAARTSRLGPVPACG